MQMAQTLDTLHTHTHTHTHTGIFIKINKFVQKISIMLFSNVLFSRIKKWYKKITYC